MKALLWGLFILLIFVNGLSYFFNVDVITEIKNIFSPEPEINIKTATDRSSEQTSEQTDPKEVYHVPGSRFTYHDAKACL